MSIETFGKYTLLRQLATGGMAEIWLAEQRGPGGFNKRMVIKRILPHLAKQGDMAQMFVDEARIVAQLTHPNIGQVFELGEHDGDYFIAMEFIDGLDLAELRDQCQREGAEIPVAHAARIIRDVLQALDYAHNFTDHEGNQVQLIHRDISPQNVLISNEGVVKLVDFGVAKTELNRTKTETGAVKGKFAYMAPEQIESQSLDQRVDIFAVGAVFYELLTGQKPFGDELQAVSRITSVDATDPRSHRSDIPEPIARIILKALQRDRQQRFSSASEMERAVESYLKGVDGVYGKRKLATMVRQLRGIETPKPTEQLFGEEKQGVERSSPRITTNEASGATGDTDRGGPSASSPAPDPTAATSTGGDGAGGGNSMTTLAIVVALFGVVAVSLAGVAGGYLLWSSAEPIDVTSEAGIEHDDGEGDPSTWQHTDDARVVVIDSQEPVELYRDGVLLGSTPYQTYLRPGDYELEIDDGDSRRPIEVSVDFTAIQRVQL